MGARVAADKPERWTIRRAAVAAPDDRDVLRDGRLSGRFRKTVSVGAALKATTFVMTAGTWFLPSCVLASCVLASCIVESITTLSIFADEFGVDFATSTIALALVGSGVVADTAVLCFGLTVPAASVKFFISVGGPGKMVSEGTIVGDTILA